MNNWPQKYDIVAAGKELGLSPKREATPWCVIKERAKDAQGEYPDRFKPIVAALPRRERLQEQLEREAGESRLRAEIVPDGSVLYFDRETEQLVADSSGHALDGKGKVHAQGTSSNPHEHQ